jgi:biotin transport system substrate-specific component
MENILKQQVVLNRAVTRIIGVAVFVLFIALGAFIRIPLPFSPVPVTMQTFFVVLAAAFLGRTDGVLAILAYILFGIAGIPLFTLAGSGLLYLAGPTAGYLFGFLIAGILTGSFAHRLKSRLSLVFLFGLAGMVILLCGTYWLKVFLRLNTASAFLIGFLPFLPGDAIKALAAAGIYSKFKTRVSH